MTINNYINCKSFVVKTPLCLDNEGSRENQLRSNKNKDIMLYPFEYFR